MMTAGIPGELSSSQKLNENILSGATLVAHLGRADFDGHITYDDDNNGDIVTGGGPSGVEVYASGMRNPYGILLHSNGKLYGTDNGANVEYVTAGTERVDMSCSVV
jgi:glucose/arabinose dehydrogenase